LRFIFGLFFEINVANDTAAEFSVFSQFLSNIFLIFKISSFETSVKIFPSSVKILYKIGKTAVKGVVSFSAKLFSS